ncbi:MAG: hypothetical protein AAGA53_04935 [Pseudomonadota bacterium]
MNFSKQNRILHQIEEYVNIIKSSGLHITTGSDFSYFTSIPKVQPARHNINPAFDPKHTNLNARNAIWMIVLNSDGEIVGTQAMQILPNRELKFGEYLGQNIWNFRSYGYDLDKSKTNLQLSENASEMEGVIAYHGELWLKGGEGGLRGGSMVIMLTRLMILVGLLKWTPDFFIGLQSPLTSCRGLATREGYMRTEQRSISWYQKKSATPMEDWLVWMSREEAEFNLRLPADFFHDMFDKKVQAESPEQLSKIA